MSIQYILLVSGCALAGIVCICVALLAAREQTSKGQLVLVLIMMAVIIVCSANLTMQRVKTLEEMINALKIRYFGGIFVLNLFPIFLDEYFHERTPRWLLYIEWTVNLIGLSVILTCQEHTLFFTAYGIEFIKGYPILRCYHGIYYYILYTVWYIMFAYILGGTLRHLLRNRKTKEWKRYFYIYLGCLIPMVVIILSQTKILRNLDLISPSLMVAGMFFIVAIRKYHMFDLEQNAKEYVMDNTAEGIVIVDHSMDVLYFNKAYKKLNPEVMMYQKLPQKQAMNIEQVLTEFKADSRYYESHNTALYRKDNTLEGYLCEIKDVTNDKEDLEQINCLTTEAEMANQKKSAFLANMSHEIRTPINAILGMDEMILREETDRNILEYAMNIQNAGNGLLCLINDILDYSKLESGKMEIIRTEYKTLDMIRGVKKNVMMRKERKGKQMILEVDENFPQKLYGDENRVLQLLSYITLNTVKYNKEWTTKIHLGMVPMDEMIDNYPAVKCDVSIIYHGYSTVNKDFDEILKKAPRTPMAIEEYVENIDKKSVFQGEVDLTVAIAYQLLIRINASIYQKNVDGNSEIHFQYEQGVVDSKPIGKIDFEKIKEVKEQDTEVFKAPGKRVLVVDDNAVNLKVMEGLLKRTKVQTTLASSGKECLELVKENTFDLIFMDHLMPEMDGIETLQELLKMEAFDQKKTSVIALTANVVSGAREKYKADGFSDYLMKPVNGKNLEEMMKQYL